jgi:hypothetical protein
MHHSAVRSAQPSVAALTGAVIAAAAAAAETMAARDRPVQRQFAGAAARSLETSAQDTSAQDMSAKRMQQAAVRGRHHGGGGSSSSSTPSKHGRQARHRISAPPERMTESLTQQR